MKRSMIRSATSVSGPMLQSGDHSNTKFIAFLATDNGYVMHTSVAHPVDIHEVSSSELGWITGYSEVFLRSPQTDVTESIS
jgi:hypothetical protein